MLPNRIIFLLTLIGAVAVVAEFKLPVDINQQVTLSNSQAARKRVNVELFVMSKCPDARLCEMTMDKVLAHPGIPDKVNLRLSYIGEHDEAAPHGISCMHGESECEGNIQQLCIVEHASPKQSWSFITCQSFGTLGDVGRLDYAKECAASAGIDWVESGVDKCVKGPAGTRLLQDSVDRSRKAGIHTSCTITVQDKVRCVHDGEWRDCNGGHETSDFVKTIENIYKHLN